MDTCVCCDGSSRRASPKSPSLHRYPLRSALVAFSSTLAALRPAQHPQCGARAGCPTSQRPGRFCLCQCLHALQWVATPVPQPMIACAPGNGCSVRTWLQVAMQDARRMQILHACRTIARSCPHYCTRQAHEGPYIAHKLLHCVPACTMQKGSRGADAIDMRGERGRRTAHPGPH